MADESFIADRVAYRSRSASVRAEASALSIQTINGVLCQVDDLNNVTPLLGGVLGGIVAITGDVIATGPGTVNSTIQPGVVTYAKMQTAGANTFLGNPTGSTAAIAEFSPSTARTLLGLAAVATSGSATDLTAGTLAVARLPASGVTAATYTGPYTVDVTGRITAAANLALTTAEVIFGAAGGGLAQSANFMYDGATSRLFVQTPTSSATAATAVGLINAISDTAVNPGIVSSTSINNASSTPIIRTQRSRGTYAVPTVVQNLDTLGTFRAGAHNGTSYATMVDIISSVDGTASVGSLPPTNIGIYVPSTAAADATLHAPAFAVSWQRDIILQTYALANNAMFGFTYYTAMAGIPSGTPNLPSIKDFTTVTGVAPQGVPTVVDSTNKRLYGYFGAAWHYASFDDGASTAGITALTGDVTATGPGSAAAAIANNAVTTVKILNNAVTLAKLATQADQTILGNGSGASAIPVALVVSGATGIIASATTLKASTAIGLAGGQTIYGGTLTTQGIVIQANIADTTTGSITLKGAAVHISAFTASSENPALIFDAGVAQAITKSGGAFTIGTTDANALVFEINHTTVAYFDASTAAFTPNTDRTYNLGSGARAWEALWVETLALAGAPATAGFFPGIGFGIDSNTTGIVAITHQSTNGRWISDVNGLAFFDSTAGVAKQTVGANVNNVAATGTTGQFDDFTNGAVYATDYANLHATVSQLCRTVAQLTVAMRNYKLGG